jgi:hypothetical protein
MRNGTYRFGPGSLEQIELIAAPASHQRFTVGPTDSGHTQVRVRGFYTIYCGMGNEHTVRIRGMAYCLGCEADNFVGVELDGRVTDLDEIAAQLVEFELEGWFDPCTEEGDGGAPY